MRPQLPSEQVSDGRFNVYLPLVVASEVDVEVKSEFRTECVNAFLAVVVEVCVSQACVCFDFEHAGLAFVTAKGVHEVNLVEKHYLCQVEGCFAFSPAEFVDVDCGLSLHCQPVFRCKPFC